MFCPNCGTQNPDAAQTCSKCGFHLRSAAAPKFKGTMLMMNPPGATPAPPAAPAPVPRPPGAAPMPNKLKGTMVGVAPPPTPYQPQVPGQAPPPAGPSPQGPPFQGAAQGAAHAPWPGAGAGGPSDAGVNPLGGTVAADQNAFAAPQGGLGAPGGGAAPYGSPPGYGPPQGPPAHGFGGPPNPPGPPEGYGPPAPPYPYPPYGAPPAGYAGQQLMKTPVQGMMAYGQPPNAGAGTAAPSPPGTTNEPTPRDARMTFLRPGAVVLGGFLLYVLLGLVSSSLAGFGVLVMVAGAVWYGALAVQMATELKGVTKNEGFAWWPIFVPGYNLYWAFVLVPQEVGRAKQIAGVLAPVRPLLHYVLMWPFALASDLNDLVPPGRRGASPSSAG